MAALVGFGLHRRPTQGFLPRQIQKGVESMSIFTRSLLRYILLILAAGLLAGCSYVGQGLDHIGNGFHRTARAVRSF